MSVLVRIAFYITTKFPIRAELHNHFFLFGKIHVVRALIGNLSLDWVSLLLSRTLIAPNTISIPIAHVVRNM